MKDLTKREHFAIEIMKAICANANTKPMQPWRAAELSVRSADELIKELSKNK